MFEVVNNILEKINEEKRIKEQKLKEYKEYIDSIDDQIVKSTTFQTLKKGGFGTSTHVLVEDNFGNYIFQINLFIKLFFFLYIISPIIYFAFFISYEDFLKQILVFENFLFLLVVPSGIFMYFFLFKSYVFDFGNGYFYEKRFEKKLFEYANNSKYQNKVIPLKNIHALQLLAETVSGGKNHSSYISYELNIILKDSTRINIVDHGDLKQLKKDAKKIADKLKIKIYDVTDFFV